MDKLFRSNFSVSFDLVSLPILKIKKITLLKKPVSLILRNGVFLKLILNPSIKLVGSNLPSILSLVLELLSKHIVDIVFCSSTICVLDSKKSKNIVFSLLGRENIQNDVVQPVRTPEHLKCLFWPKCPSSTLGLTKGQMRSKPSQNLSFSEIYDNFEQV